MAFFRKRKRNGKTFYYWVATVPVRQEDGSIGWTKVERGTGTGNLNEAREKAKLFDREYHDKLDRPISEVTPQFIFAEAATLYMKNGGSARYLKPILNEIGLKAVSDIDQGAIQELADKLYPGCQPATINRQIFTPVLAVVNFAAELRKCPPPLLVRPRGHDKVPALEIPSEEWYDAVLPHLTTKMRALVLLLTLHGLRISEAINRKPNELNTKNWTLSVPDTKTGDPIQVRLSGPVIEALKDMQRELQDQDAKRKAKGKEPLARRWLFGTANRSNVYRSLKTACTAAGSERYGSHALGRHAFATRILNDGKSLKHLKEAGRWKTIKMPAQRYGHLERSEVDESVNDLADRWSKDRDPEKVVKLNCKA